MSADNKAIIRRLYEEVWKQTEARGYKPNHLSQPRAPTAPMLRVPPVGPEAYKRQLLAFLAGYFRSCTSLSRTSLPRTIK